jgi:hypothetical protein
VTLPEELIRVLPIVRPRESVNRSALTDKDIDNRSIKMGNFIWVPWFEFGFEVAING